MNKMLSLILLAYQSESRLEETVSLTVEKLKLEGIPFELIIIDDGSKDKSFEIALKLESEISEVRAYQLSKNNTSPYATFAGLSLCKGGCAQAIPDDMQKPLNVIVEAYRLWEKGNKLILTQYSGRNDGRINDFFSNSYYNLMRMLTNLNIPKGGFGGFCIDREIIDIINNKISHINTSTSLELLHLGYDPLFLKFERPTVDKKSTWTTKKKIRYFYNNFFSSTNFPIKFITIIGFVTFLLSFLLIVVIILAKLFSDNELFGFPVQGWATIIVLVSFFNGMVLFSLGIVAEYIWRIYEEVRGRPAFIIKKKQDEN